MVSDEAADAAAARGARPLPARRDRRRAGLWLRDDEAAARAGPLDRRRGLDLPAARSPGARAASSRRTARPNGGPPRKYYQASPEGRARARGGRGRVARGARRRGSVLGLVEAEVRRERVRRSMPSRVEAASGPRRGRQRDGRRPRGRPEGGGGGGCPPEEVLGSGAFDPRSFAASWAAERGVIGPVAVRVERARCARG